MRRLPIYFIIDVSESMVGEPIEQVQSGIRNIVQDLRTDPYALETVFISVIAFAGKAKSLMPLTELYKFYPPVIPIGGGTALGNALDFLMTDIDKSVQKTTLESKGDWKPIVFLFTDGTPTDNPSRPFEKWNKHYRKGCNLVAVSIGDNVNTQLLGQITDNVLRLKDTDEKSFREFFKWITASIKTSSMSVSETAEDDVKLAHIDGINLEKVDPNDSNYIDENFAVVMGKCQTTNKPYLIKYAKRIKGLEGTFASLNLTVRDYKLVGAYPIDEVSYNELSDESSMKLNINTSELFGSPTCPCCGNQLGFVVCGDCGNIFCVGEDPHSKCPWCGMDGYLTEGNSGGINVNRTQG
ncbi:MAG: VWA domain-containing protein [Bacteroidales bacterium]|nr:VWA domain-containing protein [Bacteroidales bacterium]